MFYKSFPEFQSLIITVALHYIVLSLQTELVVASYNKLQRSATQVSISQPQLVLGASHQIKAFCVLQGGLDTYVYLHIHLIRR
jgi:hypothetical protein